MEHVKITTYQEAVALAKKRKIILAEYGDGADHSTAEAYCYWNQSGNRRAPAEIYIEYDFDGLDYNGNPTLAGTVHFSEVADENIYRWKYNRQLSDWDNTVALVKAMNYTPEISFDNFIACILLHFEGEQERDGRRTLKSYLENGILRGEEGQLSEFDYE
jgi:hypothetical protein